MSLKPKQQDRSPAQCKTQHHGADGQVVGRFHHDFSRDVGRLRGHQLTVDLPGRLQPDVAAFGPDDVDREGGLGATVPRGRSDLRKPGSVSIRYPKITLDIQKRPRLLEGQVDLCFIALNGSYRVGRGAKFNPNWVLLSARGRGCQRARANQPVHRGNLRHDLVGINFTKREGEHVKAPLELEVVFLKEHRRSARFVADLQEHRAFNPLVQVEVNGELNTVFGGFLDANDGDGDGLLRTDGNREIARGLTDDEAVVALQRPTQGLLSVVEKLQRCKNLTGSTLIQRDPFPVALRGAGRERQSNATVEASCVSQEHVGRNNVPFVPRSSGQGGDANRPIRRRPRACQCSGDRHG